MEMGIKQAKRELASFENVIRDTVRMLDNGREQLFTAAGNARNEARRVHQLLLNISEEILAVDSQLVMIREKEETDQIRLRAVTQSFEQFSEDEIKAAFERAKELKVILTQLTERRSQLENKQKELETNMASLHQTAEKAEGMVAQVGVAMDFIKGNLNDINVKIENIHQKQQMGLQVIKAQEEERKRVAREIHDGPAQSLANVAFRMEFCEKLMEMEPDKVKDELRELKNLVTDNLQDVRKIIFDLRPMALDDLGIIPALKRYINNYKEEKKLDVRFAFFGKKERIEPGLEVALFRLIQESLNNAAKHSNAQSVNVVVEIRDHYISASIEDDGRGFDLDSFMQTNTGHFGLISMKERVDLLGGQLEINTGPGKGTKVRISLPIDPE